MHNLLRSPTARALRLQPVVCGLVLCCAAGPTLSASLFYTAVLHRVSTFQTGAQAGLNPDGPAEGTSRFSNGLSFDETLETVVTEVYDPPEPGRPNSLADALSNAEQASDLRPSAIFSSGNVASLAGVSGPDGGFALSETSTEFRASFRVNELTGFNFGGDVNCISLLGRGTCNAFVTLTGPAGEVIADWRTTDGQSGGNLRGLFQPDLEYDIQVRVQNRAPQVGVGNSAALGLYQLNLELIPAAAIPEPATTAMWLLGLGGLVLAVRRRHPR